MDVKIFYKKELEGLTGQDAKPISLLPLLEFTRHKVESDSLITKAIVGNDDSVLAGLIEKLENSDWVQEGLKYLPEKISSAGHSRRLYAARRLCAVSHGRDLPAGLHQAVHGVAGLRLFLIVVTAVIGILSFFIIGLLDRAWIFVLFGFGLLGLSFGQSDGTRPNDLARIRFRGLLPDVGRGRDADRSLHPPAHVQ